MNTQLDIVYLDKITGWAEKNLDRSNPYALPTEWYTLSENLYRAYELTGNKRYYDFAKVWEYTDYWDILARGESVFQDILKSTPRHESYHGYSNHRLDKLYRLYLYLLIYRQYIKHLFVQNRVLTLSFQTP